MHLTIPSPPPTPRISIQKEKMPTNAPFSSRRMWAMASLLCTHSQNLTCCANVRMGKFYAKCLSLSWQYILHQRAWSPAVLERALCTTNVHIGPRLDPIRECIRIKTVRKHAFGGNLRAALYIRVIIQMLFNSLLVCRNIVPSAKAHK